MKRKACSIFDNKQRDTGQHETRVRLSPRSIGLHNMYMQKSCKENRGNIEDVPTSSAHPSWRTCSFYYLLFKKKGGPRKTTPMKSRLSLYSQNQCEDCSGKLYKALKVLFLPVANKKTCLLKGLCKAQLLNRFGCLIEGLVMFSAEYFICAVE